MDRDKLQRVVYSWAQAVFGELSMERQERVRRFLEEAIELAQAEGLPKADVDMLTLHVYGKPAGTPAQELGGVGLTLLAYAESTGLSAEDCESAEFERVQKKSPAYWRDRQNKKADAGVAVRVGEKKA